MAKLKPIKDEKELAAVPLNEPVLVELEPAASGVLAEAASEDDRAPLRVERDEPTDGPKALKAQLEASKEAERLANAGRDDAERRAREATAEADRLKTAGADTEKELLTSSLASAQADEAAAQAEFERAFDAGDAKAMGAAQAKIGRAAAKVVNFEGAVAQFDEDVAAEPERKERPEPQVDIITAIDRDPKLMPKERDWLKEHSETLTDPKLNRELSVGYDRALAAGHKRGSEGYFQFLDQFMGYAKPRSDDTADDEIDDTNIERGSHMSAPVVRENRTLGGRPPPSNRVTLSPAEREMARSMGLSDVQYAKGKVQLAVNKEADPEKYMVRR